MHRRSRRVKCTAVTFAPVAVLALGLAPSAVAVDSAAATQPSAIERLVRQEDTRAAELARFETIVKQMDRSTMLEARERARASTRLAPAAHVAQSSSGEAFAWGAAALGLAVGIAAMSLLLVCLTLVRSHGLLRSV